MAKLMGEPADDAAPFFHPTRAHPKTLSLVPTTLRATLAPLPTTARNIVGHLNMNTKCVIIIKWFWFFNNCKWIILVYSFMNKVYLFYKFLLDVSVDKFWLNTFVNDRNLILRYRKTISLTLFLLSIIAPFSLK
jgi:hypothetical protein